MKRADYPESTKWNVQDLYADEETFNAAYAEFKAELKKYSKWQNHLLDNADTLFEALEFDNKMSKNMEQLIIYGHIQNDQDTADPKYQTLYGKVVKLYESFREASAYMAPEILKGNYDLITKYLKTNPKLQPYARMLKELFKFQKYTLSKAEEQIISQISSSLATPDDVFSVLTDADLKFGKMRDEAGKMITLDEKSYRNLSHSPNRQVRKKAFHKLYQTYGQFKNTYAALLSNQVKNNNKMARVRGYDSALHASLYAADIPVAVYNNLIAVVRKNIAPLSDYWHLKQKALNVDKLHLYDTYAPLGTGSSQKYSQTEAQDLIMEALKVLGPTYTHDLEQAFTNRWIDFCPNENKRNGAYCTAAYNVHPYVLVSFDNTLENVSTLIHELGHAMHYYYAIKNNTYQDYDYAIFVAEVASQVNQILLSKYLIKQTTDKELKKYLIDDLIGDFKATIYRQTMFAEFEKQIHEYEAAGGILTNEVMNKIYYQLNKDYFGDNIVVDKLIQYEWMRIPHFYNSFYVYQYATAYAAAIKIAMDILENRKEAVNKYLQFLTLGCTIDPIASLKVAGVDMLDATTYNEAFAYFQGLVKELAELYDEEGDK